MNSTMSSRMHALGAALLLAMALICEGSDLGEFFSDLQDRVNPSWTSLKRTLKIGVNSYGPALGSTIQVNNYTKEGSYADRASSQNIALHIPTHSYIAPTYFNKISRWYQEDGNTQIFRLFPGDDNVRNSRVNAPRSEAFGLVHWQRGDGWHEWSGHYTFLKVRPGAVLQIKHNITYWSMQLILEENDDGTFDLCYVKLRDRKAKTILMEDVVGKGVDIRVLDDGENHEVYVDGELMVVNSMTDRPEDDYNRARWGLYSPKSAMDRNILILVSGVYVGPEGGEDTYVGAEGDEDTFVSKQDCRFSWLIPDAVQSWFASFFEFESIFGPGDNPILKELDAEPDSSLISRWYDDANNEGYGYF